MGLEQGLVVHIENLRIPSEIRPSPIGAPVMVSRISSQTESSRQDRILEYCKEYVRDSQKLRDLKSVKSTGKTKSGRINPLNKSRRALRIVKRVNRKHYSKTNGIDFFDIVRRNLCYGS
jgi:hypothetical protein